MKTLTYAMPAPALIALCADLRRNGYEVKRDRNTMTATAPATDTEPALVVVRALRTPWGWCLRADPRAVKATP